MKNKVFVKLKQLLGKLNTLILNHPKKSLVGFAGISIFAYAPFSIWGLMFVSFAGLTYILNNTESKKTRLANFAIFAFVFNAVNLHWVGNSFLYNSPEEFLVYLMPLLIAGMAGLLTILYIVIFAVLDLAKQTKAKQIVLIPAVFIIAEVLRSLSVFGFPWNLVGYSIATNDNLLQVSQLGTVIICSALILIIASLIAQKTKKYLIAALVVYIVWFITGTALLNGKDITQTIKLENETKLIQIDTTKHHRFDRIKMKKQVYAYLAEIKKLKYKKDIKYIVVPEMAVPYPINTEESLLKLLQRTIGQHQTLVVGAPAYNDYDIYNTMYFINKQGFKRYDKKLLVPFGEFIPFRKYVPFLKNFTNNFKDFSVGEIDNTVDFAGKKFLSLICYEAIFPFFVKQNITSDDTILLNITNDAWFYGTVAPAQHALIAKTRAVENNLTMVRVSNAGQSFIK